MQYRKLADLKKLEGNPRTISKEDMARLVESVKRFGIIEGRPLLLSNRTGELVIIGGNQRYEAAKKLKLKEVPTELMEGLTEEQEREIIIRDNVANGEWDMDALASDWDTKKLAEWGVDAEFMHDDSTDSFSLPDGEKGEIVTVTFTLHKFQNDTLESALEEAFAL